MRNKLKCYDSMIFSIYNVLIYFNEYCELLLLTKRPAAAQNDLRISLLSVSRMRSNPNFLFPCKPTHSSNLRILGGRRERPRLNAPQPSFIPPFSSLENMRVLESITSLLFFASSSDSAWYNSLYSLKKKRELSH